MYEKSYFLTQYRNAFIRYCPSASFVTSAPPTLPASQPNASLVTVSLSPKTKKQWYYPRSDYKARRMRKSQFQNCIPAEGSPSEDKKGAFYLFRFSDSQLIRSGRSNGFFHMRESL